MATVTTVDGESTYTEASKGGNSYNVGENSEPNQSGIATARNGSTNMSIAAGAVTENDMVTVRGVTMSVKDAVAYGEILPTNNGYEDSKKNESLNIKSNDNNQTETQIEKLDDDSEGIINSFNSTMGGAAVSSAVNFISQGKDIPQSVLTDTASRMGLEPHELHSQIESVREAFTEQASNRIEKYGVNPEDVFNWASENESNKLEQAIQQQFHKYSTVGYDKVAQAYIEALPEINPDAIADLELGEGIKVIKTDRGQIVLETPHGQIGWKQAINTGIIKLSPNR